MKRLIKALSSLKSQQTRNMRTTIVPRVTVFKEPPYLSFIPTDSTLAMPYLYFIPTDTTPAMRVRQGCKKFTRFVNLKLTILRAIHIQLQKSRKCRHVKGRKQTTFTTLPRQMTMFVLWQSMRRVDSLEKTLTLGGSGGRRRRGRQRMRWMDGWHHQLDGHEFG